MSADSRAFVRPYGVAAGLLSAVAAGAIAALVLSDAVVEAAGALVVATALGTGVLAVGAMHRPRAFLVLTGDATAANRDRAVLVTRLAGAFVAALALLALAAGVDAVLAYRELLQGPTTV